MVCYNVHHNGGITEATIDDNVSYYTEHNEADLPLVNPSILSSEVVFYKVSYSCS